MMEELLPLGAVVVERRNDNESTPLFPEERRLVAKAIESRVSEFTTGRSCARQALSELGFPPVPILRGNKGEPLWPHGAVGSITHCIGYRAAAVAMETRLTAIGIDAEIHAAVPAEVAQSFCVADETAWLRRATGLIHWDRVLFSAKESVYKAWFPLTQRWLGFEDVAVSIETSESRFYVRSLVSLPSELDQVLRRLAGRFLVRDGLVITSVVLPRMS